jgi:hypothetical protein
VSRAKEPKRDGEMKCKASRITGSYTPLSLLLSHLLAHIHKHLLIQYELIKILNYFNLHPVLISNQPPRMCFGDFAQSWAQLPDPFSSYVIKVVYFHFKFTSFASEYFSGSVSNLRRRIPNEAIHLRLFLRISIAYNAGSSFLSIKHKYSYNPM